MGGLSFMFGKKKTETRTKKEGDVSETGCDDGRSGYLGRRRNTGMKYTATLKKAALILCFAFFANILVQSGQRMLLQRGIAEEVLRFHVLGNSDSEEDQAVKLEVRDALLAWLEEAQGGNSVKETANTRAENDSDEIQEKCGKESISEIFQNNQNGKKGTNVSFINNSQSTKSGSKAENKNQKTADTEFLRAHLTDLETVANNVLASKNKSYQAHAELTTCYFPSRTYGACTFPSGWYEALRIKLGKAKGHNWWCVLYPRLCFTDSLHAVVEEEEMQQLSDALTEAEYDSLLHEPSRWKFTFRWF